MDFTIELGWKVYDKITSFEGVVIGQVRYLTGCNQYLVQPEGVTSDGAKKDACWFDEQRLVAIAGEAVTLDNSRGNGADMPAPMK
jgi:hypothetical protein